MKKVIRCAGWGLLLQVITGALLAILFWVVIGIIGITMLITSLFVDLGQLDPLRAFDVDELGRIGDTIVTLIVTAALGAAVVALGAAWAQIALRVAENIRTRS